MDVYNQVTNRRNVEEKKREESGDGRMRIKQKKGVKRNKQTVDSRRRRRGGTEKGMANKREE